MRFLDRLFGRRPLDFFPLSDTCKLPVYATAGASGMDLHADEDAIVPILGHVLVKTNVGVALKPGFEAQIRARSGLAAKHGISVLNGPGTIDSDYRGGLGVILFNAGHSPFVVKKGERIAQLVIARFERVSARWLKPVVDETNPVYSETARGTGGFGSTGTGALAAAGIACAAMAPASSAGTLASFLAGGKDVTMIEGGPIDFSGMGPVGDFVTRPARPGESGKVVEEFKLSETAELSRKALMQDHFDRTRPKVFRADGTVETLA